MNKDGWSKNQETLLEEWSVFWKDQKWNASRLRKPSLDWRNREHFVPHVIVAFISTFFGLRRTLTYLTVVGVPLWLIL